MGQFLSRFVEDEAGVSAVEYGLIIAIVSLAIVGAVTSFGASLTKSLTTVADGLG